MKKFLLVTTLCLALMGCDGIKELRPTPEGASTVPIPSGQINMSHKVIQQTPKGARVDSEKGLNANQLNLIDAGLTKAFEDGKASGWADDGVAYNYARYQIFIPTDACVPSPESKTPSFLVRGDNYDGSVYDQYNSKGPLPVEQQDSFKKYVPDGVGVLYASEMLWSLNTEGSMTDGKPSYYASFVVCSDESVLQNGAEYGAEHAIVARYDVPYFAETETHSTIGHPILPKRSSAVGLLAKPQVKSSPAKLNQPIPEMVK